LIDDLIGAETVHAREFGVTLKQPNIETSPRPRSCARRSPPWWAALRTARA
jgi:hypothetical protein